jgi:hypothetical protein
MNNWTATELAFRCDRLPTRIERLTDNFLSLKSLSLEGNDAAVVLTILRESKVFIELIAIDLDIDSAYELAQIQRQLSQWHIHWPEAWTTDANRNEISTLSEIWANRLREMSRVFA